MTVDRHAAAHPALPRDAHPRHARGTARRRGDRLGVRGPGADHPGGGARLDRPPDRPEPRADARAPGRRRDAVGGALPAGGARHRRRRGARLLGRTAAGRVRQPAGRAGRDRGVVGRRGRRGHGDRARRRVRRDLVGGGGGVRGGPDHDPARVRARPQRGSHGGRHARADRRRDQRVRRRPDRVPHVRRRAQRPRPGGVLAARQPQRRHLERGRGGCADGAARRPRRPDDRAEAGPARARRGPRPPPRRGRGAAASVRDRARGDPRRLGGGVHRHHPVRRADRAAPDADDRRARRTASCCRRARWRVRSCCCSPISAPAPSSPTQTFRWACSPRSSAGPSSSGCCAAPAPGKADGRDDASRSTPRRPRRPPARTGAAGRRCGDAAGVVAVGAAPRRHGAARRRLRGRRR